MWPNTHFEAKNDKQKVKISALVKGITGIGKSLIKY